MSERQIIVVDTETTGLDPAVHIAVEVAWINLDTDELGRFVPPHHWREIAAVADPKSLRVNGYLERLLGCEQDLDGGGAAALAAALDGNVLAGSNPTFDAGFLQAMFRRSVYDPEFERTLLTYDVFEPTWHHRLLDLSAYAAGVLGIDPTELPGLADVCDRLGVVNSAPHAAHGDRDATAECFRLLRKQATEQTDR